MIDRILERGVESARGASRSLACRGLARASLVASMILGTGAFGAAAGTSTVEVSSDVIAERLSGAMRFETVSYEDPADFRGGPFDELEAYLRDLYPRTFATLDLEKVAGYSLLLKWQGTDPSLAPALFMSHTDVVPVSEAAAENWSHPPYAGVIEDGYVWGRGALDVKSGVIFWLESVEALLEEGLAPKRTLYLFFGHDEEIGGRAGASSAAALLKERGVRLAFLFDEGGMIMEGHPLIEGRTVAMVSTAEKAYFTVELITRGVSGHSSIPPESTAIGRLARAINAVEKSPMPARISLPVREMLERAAPYLPFSRRLAMNNLWLFGGMVKRSMLAEDLSRAMVRTTFATTLISGGVKDNVLPERAQATINVRILPGDTPEQVVSHIEKAIDDPEVEVKGTTWGEAAAPASVEGLGFQIVEAAVGAQMPDAVVLPSLIPGATDTRHFAGVADEILRFVPMQVSPELIGGAHGRDERLAVEPLARSRMIAIDMVRRAAMGDEAPASGE